jgi:hypothetical protein
LCSRDAKFAVDCDTCRLSYCLVCLASGSKDPCVRCGHRPSKRMEQLVHLRLKSIYKAFKQSSRNSKYGGDGGEGDEDDDDDEDVDDNDDDDKTDGGKSGDPQSLLQAAASAASKHSSGGRSNSSRHHQHHSHHTGSKRSTGNSGSSASRDQQAKEMVDKYMAEKEKADAAAAALLAELEEEEEAIKSKKNKKKRKKERQQAKKEEEHKKEEEPPSPQKSTQKEQPKQTSEKKDDNMEVDTESKKAASVTAKTDAFSAAGNESEKVKKKKKKDKEKKAQIGQGKSDNNKDDTMETSSAENIEQSADDFGPNDKETDAVDPIEQELCQLVAAEDADGLEELLAKVKGVPGRATLRKNAKKALKKLKAAAEEEAEAAAAAAAAERAAEEEATRKREAEKAQKEHQHGHHHQNRPGSGTATPATQSETNSSSGRHQPLTQLQPNELLRVVSQTHNKPPSTAGPGSSHPNPRGSRGHAANAAGASTAARSESVLHMAPTVVGWVIGKGGQRIRDLMEESGAKVWIDQEHLSPNDPRVVYVSGNRKSVESAVRMIKDLVAKAPIIGAGGATVPPAASAATASSSLLHPIAAKANKRVQESPLVVPAAAAVEHKQPFAAAVTGVGNKPSQRSSQGKATGVSQPVNDEAIASGETPLSSLLFKAENPIGDTAEQVTLPVATGEQVKVNVDSEHYKEHVLTCEACFVPLLIGRRGWTIKHIQDSSGARVDIDQTVIPRRIKISGDDENVQTAIRMVRDVLSYPHAQLQGATATAEDIEHAAGSLNGCGDPRHVLGSLDHVAATGASLQVGESTAATQSTTVGASNQILTPAIHSPPVAAAQTTERVHTPPPSSLINIGDAKSTISASSSLSSTPEPSMASSSKGHYGTTGTSAPLLPPEYGGVGNFAQHPNLAGSNLFSQQNNLHQMGLGNSNSGASGELLPSQQNVAPPPLFPSGMSSSAIPSISPQYDLPTGLPRSFAQTQQQQQQQQQHLQRQYENQQSMIFGQSILQEQQQLPQNLRPPPNGLGGVPHQNAHFQPRHEPKPAMHHSNSLQYPPVVPNQRNPIHLHQQSAFHPSSQKQIRHNSAPELGIGNVRPNAVTDLGVGKLHDPHGIPANYAPGMWNDRSASLVLGSEGPTGGQLHRPVPPEDYPRGGSIPIQGRDGQGTELRMNSGPSSLGLGNDFIGLPSSSLDTGPGHGLRPAGGRGQSSSVLASSGRDDSLMVDSLFGPSETNNEAKNLITGFQGLALGEGLGSDMWTKDLSQSWNSNDQKLSAGFRESQGSSALFAAIQPTLDAHDVQHPSRSRFGWGASNES